MTQRIEVKDQEWIKEETRIELLAVFLQGGIRRNGRTLYPDKWVLRATDLTDTRNSVELYYDHKFPAKMEYYRGKPTDILLGQLRRKRLTKISKRNVKRTDVSNRSGSGIGQGKAATRNWIQDVYNQFPNARPDIEKERMIIATLIGIGYYQLRIKNVI